MRSSRTTEVSCGTSAQLLADHSIGTDSVSSWKSLSQSKAALRHIENQLEAGPGTSVLLDSVMDPPKKKSSRPVNRRDEQRFDDTIGSSKYRGHRQTSPKKSSSRSPLRNATQDSNVRKNNGVEFREPLASYREATPPPHPSAQLEAYTLQSVPGSWCPSSPPPSDSLPSQSIYQRDARGRQTHRVLDSTHASAAESTEVRYLNDQLALDTLKTVINQSHLTGEKLTAREGDSTHKAQFSHSMDTQESSTGGALATGSPYRGDSTPSSSPGSASQRLENLRRHQPDDKLEKLKERIRRQRQHLEEAAEREKLLSNLERPIMPTERSGTRNITKVRKVAAAPPPPIYKGFNSTETNIRIPDGKVLKEQDFHHLSREIYRDLSQQFAESTRSRHQQQREREQRADRSKERRPSKPVRKVHRAASASETNAKPVISPASWREGQKVVKMILGPVPKLLREDKPQPADRLSRTAPRHRSTSEPRSELNHQSRHSSTERAQSMSKGPTKGCSPSTSTPPSAAQDKAPVGLNADQLSADIQGILDDLQLECKAAEKEERARQRSRRTTGGRRGRGGSVPQTRTPVSVWGTNAATVGYSRGCRSASPATRRPESANTAEAGQKKRPYDADTVRQYIARQQEERKRRQAEEKRAQQEEAERKNQRLQELYRKQREAAKTVTLPSEASLAPVQKRLQETYTKLLLEEAQLGNEATQMPPTATATQLVPQRPVYQPSGESDKENKRLEPPQSPSSSDRSLNDQPAPVLTRSDLDAGVTSFFQPDHLSPAAGPTAGPSSSPQIFLGDHFLSQLLMSDIATSPGNLKHTPRPTTASSQRSQSKMSRIEAIKASAAVLSNRIESEARKFAGDDINYGATTSLDVDATLDPRFSQTNREDGSWAEAAARAPTHDDDVALRIQRILHSAGHSSYNGTALPGAGNLHAFREQKGKNGSPKNRTQTQATSAHAPAYPSHSYPQEKRRLSNGLERKEKSPRRGYEAFDHPGAGQIRTDVHDSSAGSISEGPLSEGSLSEEEAIPLHSSKSRVPRAADCLESVAYCAGQRRDYQRLSEFQKEAAKCSPFSSSFAQQDGSKAAWEELSKGSPLSVINIFTRNLHSHVKADERTSPSAHSVHSGNHPRDAAVYEDDFVSSHSSAASGQLRKGSNSPSANSHFEELMRRSPFEKNGGGFHSHRSSVHSPHLSSGSTSGSSPQSRQSSRKLGTASDQSGATLVGEERNSCSPPSKALSADSRKRSSDISSAHSQAKNFQGNDTAMSGHSHQSVGLNGKKSPAARHRHTSPFGSPDSASPQAAESSAEPLRGSSLGGEHCMNAGLSGHSRKTETRITSELQYSPAVLQQRMAAELQYLESIEESVRQLGDVERLMGVSMAQQESASLAQMLKAKQQCHERDLYELKIKAEREALEAKLQLEENRQRVARAHIELQESLAVTQKETLESFQDATTKMMSQQAEAARYTADTARHIKEMTEMARSQMAGVLTAPPVAPESHVSLPKRQNSESDSLGSDDSHREIRPKEPESSLNSLSQSDSLSFRRPKISGTNSSSHHSPSYTSTNHMDHPKKETAEVKRRKGGDDKRKEGGAGSSSIEEEVPTAANDSLCSDSIPSIIDEKGESTSVATEYSHKFDESMTEDEIEERSFRSLLPSEAHRRGTLDKRPRHHEESEDDGADHNSLSVSVSHTNLKDANMPFTSGQDSFSQFTMDMVRQYMKDEEVRLQHQSSLLGLRQKALKEKIRTELAWLEHQKKKLRDKGEDDKMPPIRKKQRGLLMRLQQEQAEIKRLQEANKAARKEQQLLLKQQEEIQRMRSSTMRLKERLKCAGCEEPPETPIPETPVSEAASPSSRHGDEILTPSPAPSISGSETSSIMQKLKKMRTHMDEKFLTKREQQLMQRRRHAEELLQWKQRLDQEEAEVRKIEKEALTGWDKDRSVPESQKKEKKELSDISASSSRHRIVEPRTDSEKEYVSEGDCSSVTPESSIHTEEPGYQQSRSPSAAQIASVPETPSGSIQSSPPNYTQDFTSASASPSPSKQSPTFKGSHSPAPSPSDGSSKSKMLRSSQISNQARNQSSDTPVASQEPISDQSDIESRIKALKEELRKRKFMAYQLKKEQKKRNKERLKAQEASLLKQLESYNNYIEKTQAELNKEPDSTPSTKSQNKGSNSVAERSSIKAATDRSESSRIPDSERKQFGSSIDHNAPHQSDDNRSTSAPVELSDEDIPTVTPTPVSSSPECPTPGLRSNLSSPVFSRPSSKKSQAHIPESGAENAVSDQFPEELELEISSKLEDQYSEGLLKLDMEDGLVAKKHTSVSPVISKEHEAEIARRDSSESFEIEKSSVNIPSKLHSAAVDNKSSEQRSPSLNDSSHLPDSDFLLSKKKESSKDADASPSAEGYNDDFESSGDSSPREGQHSSKPTSPSSVFPAKVKSSRKDSASRFSQGDSIDEEVEDISEELSRHSDTSVPSHDSGRLLDLHRQTEDSNSIPSPPVSPIKDEMPSFNIGDRVLVGSVQPGTLRFKGATSFANGFWAGVELDKSEGSNNGTYDGVVYFECDACHGIFAPPDKISHLPDKFEVYTDTTEDEDSFFDDVPDNGRDTRKTKQNKSQKQGNLNAQNDEDINKNYGFGDKKATGEVPPKAGTQHPRLPISNGNIMLDLEETPDALLIIDTDRTGPRKPAQKEGSALVERGDVELSPTDASVDVREDKAERHDRDSLDSLADTLIKNFVADTVKQFAEIKKAKEQKIQASNQSLFGDNNNEEWLPAVEQKDDLPFFLSGEKEELSSPELCNRTESPVLGASGQEELAKRLAELELSRELLDEIGDDQDWFDEDFGLSSRRQQQRLKEKQREEEEEAKLGPAASVSSAATARDGEQQAKTPPRPALPLPMPPKLPEQPAMVVPHTASEVEKMVHAAVKEMWEGCGLANNGTPSLAKLPCPKPSQEYFGKEASSQDQEALCIRSYRKAVYDLTWEILQDIYAEDPNADQPQWVKPRRARSSHFHRVKAPGDITKIQEFISTEVLKLYGLAKDRSQKTDWQKMLKFGRKKRDRVDHILVQELHEEEVQWVNYDEDELFVKMQLADSIFDALLKDTVNVLSLISDKRAKRGTLS